MRRSLLEIVIDLITLVIASVIALVIVSAFAQPRALGC